MFSRSCAGHTISTSGHQWSFWPGDRWRHVFGSRLHFYALSAIRIRRPSCYDVRAFPECSNARLGMHEMRALEHFLTCLLVGRLTVWCTDMPDFTSMSLNIFHASKTVCKRSVANVFMLFGKRVVFDTVLNIADHITLACGSIIMLKCFLEFF